MAISFTTTYDKEGNPQRVNISGTSFQSGGTYQANPNNPSQVQQTAQDGVQFDEPIDVKTNQQLREEFGEVLQNLQDFDVSTLNKDNLGEIKKILEPFPIVTTDPNEQRNAYQLFLNSMLGGAGAKPLDVNQLDNFFQLKRLGPTMFRDPTVPSNIFRDVKGLLTGANEAVMNFPREGIGSLVTDINYGQEGKDKAEELGIRDLGGSVGALVKALTPAKYLDFILNSGPFQTAQDFASDLTDKTSNIVDTALTPFDQFVKLIDSIGDDE